MRIILISFIAILLSCQSLYAQETDCGCEQAFQKLISKVETEYPGFAGKTTDKFLYESLKETLKKESQKTVKASCLKLLQKYIGFFKDPHLQIALKATSNGSDSTSSAKSVDIDIKDFQQKSQNTIDKFEGVWADDSYKVGLKKSGENEYVGFIIEARSPLWKPKEIKFRLLPDGKFEYALLDRSLKTGSYQIHDGYLLHLSEINVTFVKQMPKPAIDATSLQAKLDELEGFYFKQLTPKTSIIKISSFDYPKLERIDKILNDNKILLEKSENLIIDIRDNPGGTDNAYQKLLPYIATNPIRGLMAEFLATQTYIDSLEDYLKSLKEPEKEKSETAETKKKIEVLKANLGKFVNSRHFDKNNPPVYIRQIEPAQHSPKQIVFLANKGVGSAAENFLLQAKQSKKVKILGVPTYGGLDYGNSYWISFGCQNYQVFMPTYRASRLPEYPIDNIGVQPDVYLDPSVKDWISYAVQYLEN